MSCGHGLTRTYRDGHGRVPERLVGSLALPEIALPEVFEEGVVGGGGEVLHVGLGLAGGGALIVPRGKSGFQIRRLAGSLALPERLSRDASPYLIGIDQTGVGKELFVVAEALFLVGDEVGVAAADVGHDGVEPRLLFLNGGGDGFLIATGDGIHAGPGAEVRAVAGEVNAIGIDGAEVAQAGQCPAPHSRGRRGRLSRDASPYLIGGRGRKDVGLAVAFEAEGAVVLEASDLDAGIGVEGAEEAGGNFVEGDAVGKTREAFAGRFAASGPFEQACACTHSRGRRGAGAGRTGGRRERRVLKEVGEIEEGGFGLPGHVGDAFDAPLQEGFKAFAIVVGAGIDLIDDGFGFPVRLLDGGEGETQAGALLGGKEMGGGSQGAGLAFAALEGGGRMRAIHAELAGEVGGFVMEQVVP